MEVALETIIYVIIALAAFSILVILFKQFSSLDIVSFNNTSIKEPKDIIPLMINCSKYGDNRTCFILNVNFSLQALNDTLNAWKVNETLNYSLYVNNNSSTIIIKNNGNGVILYG